MRRSFLGWSLAAALSVSPIWSASVSRAAAPAQDQNLTLGRALYVTHCAACHGEAGRGDGASAVGFATKPSNLTDGRLLNALPDEFLVSIIRHGGPAEGLSPGMPPFGLYLGEAQIRQTVAYLRSLAVPPSSAPAAPIVTVPGAPRQPIFFSHLIHTGEYQIACQYCHADARRSEYAGLPSVERCMGCHKIIGAQDNPEIGKIHDYWRRGQPIPWVRIFKVPEFTYFPHKAHLRFGLECQTCHGPIERVRVVGGATGRSLAIDLLNLVGFKLPPRPLTMGWCVECHRHENAARNAKAPLDCVTCHH